LVAGGREGNFEDDPTVVRNETWLSLPGDGGKGPANTTDEDLSHMTNWLEALRNNRQPSASVLAGYAHSVACIMAAQSYWAEGNFTGIQRRKVFWTTLLLLKHSLGFHMTREVC